jgi:hypothetical protein
MHAKKAQPIGPPKIPTTTAPTTKPVAADNPPYGGNTKEHQHYSKNISRMCLLKLVTILLSLGWEMKFFVKLAFKQLYRKKTNNLWCFFA